MCPQLTVQMLQLKIPQAKTKTEDPHVLQPRPSKAKINKWFLKRGLGGQGKTSASAASASPAIMSDSDPAWCPSQKHEQQVRACVSSDLPLRSRPGSLCPSSWQACRSQERPSLAKRSLCAHRCVHSDCPSHRCTSCSSVTVLKPRPHLASGSQTCTGRLSLLPLLRSWSDWLFYRQPGAGLDPSSASCITNPDSGSSLASSPEWPSGPQTTASHFMSSLLRVHRGQGALLSKDRSFE